MFSRLLPCVALFTGCQPATDKPVQPALALAKPPAELGEMPAPQSAGTKSFPPLRLIPLNHAGDPIGCQLDLDRPPVPCDIELKADGSVFDRRLTSAIVGRLQPGFTLVSARSGKSVFELRSDGILIGTGPLHEGSEHAQVLFCRLSADPILECFHQFDQVLVDQRLIWNEKNCRERWVATVEEDEIIARFAGYPEKVVVARVQPPPADVDARLAALFLSALIAVQGDTTTHAPKRPE